MDFSRFESEIRHGIDEGWHLGVQVCVLRDGEEVLHDAFGHASPGERLTVAHFMLWLSATKPLVAIALARLWERGKVDLDGAVCDVIPAFAEHGKEGITLRHLLMHTGGMRSADMGWRPRPWEDAVDLVCRARKEPRWEPGEKAGYHVDSSWYMLGEVIRRVDGRAFSQYMRDEIFQPLGCVYGWIGMPEPEIEYFGGLVAPVYDVSSGEAEEVRLFSKPSVLGLARPGGNGRGPAQVLARFYGMLLAGGTWGGQRVVEEDTVREFSRRHRVGMYDHTFQHTMDWGLGFHVNSHVSGEDTVPYGFGAGASLDSYGHGGNRSSMAFADPAYGLSVAIVCNGMPVEEVHQRRMRGLLAALYEDLGL